MMIVFYMFFILHINKSIREKIFFITLRLISYNKRIILIAEFNKENKQKAAIYKRYLKIFFFRVSEIYTGIDCYTTAINKLNEYKKNPEK